MIRYRTPARSEAERRQRNGFARWFETYATGAQAWWQLAEYETRLYATELAEFKQLRPRPTLKAYMLSTAGQTR